jgi:hypothetical protein
MDPGGAAGRPFRLNPRTRATALILAVLVAAASFWLTALWSVPGIGGEPGPIWIPGLLIDPVFVLCLGIFFAPPEWTISDGWLSRRSWRSMPGTKPTRLVALGPDVEIVHETRNRWRMQPDGYEIVTWGRSAGLAAAMAQAGVRVDDFRGDWERQHPVINALAVLAYVGAVAALLSTPLFGFAIGHGIPLTPVVVGICLVMVGRTLDRGPWRQPKPSSQAD